MVVFMTIFISYMEAVFTPCQVLADDAADSRQLVMKARLTFENFVSDPDMSSFRDLVKKAKGIFIAPQVLKGAFILGASGGSGVLLARSMVNRPWSGPAFYTIGEISFGFQAGGKVSEVILLAMSERGVSAFLGNSFKLGGNIGVTVGPVGAGVSAASANLSMDILSFSTSTGLYGGFSLGGAIVAVRKGLNIAYYGQNTDPSDILIRQKVKNSQSDELIKAVEKAAGP